MDLIYNVLFNIFTGTGKSIPLILVTGLMSGVIVNTIKKEADKSGKYVILVTNELINTVKDPDLKEIIRHGIRYIAKRYPDESGKKKMKMLVDSVQNATPNLIISNKELTDIAQVEFLKVKHQLENI